MGCLQVQRKPYCSSSVQTNIPAISNEGLKGSPSCTKSPLSDALPSGSSNLPVCWHMYTQLYPLHTLTSHSHTTICHVTLKQQPG